MGRLRPVDDAPPLLQMGASEAAVASDGESWLAVYEADSWLTATRIQSNGLRSDYGFAVGPSEGQFSQPRVVFDGVDFLVAFQTNSPVRGIGIQRLRARGPGAIVYLDLQADWVGFDLALDDRQAPRVLACERKYTKSTCATAELAGEQVTIRPTFDLPFLASRLQWAFSGGTGFAIVETESHAVALLDISTEGELLDWRNLEVEAPAGDSALPTIVATPDGYAAAWHRADGIRVIALTADGELAGDQLVPGDGSLSRPVLVPTPEAWLLLSSSDSAMCDDCVNVYAQRLKPALDEVPGSPVLIAEDTNDAAVAAATGSKALVVLPGPTSLDAALVDAAQPAAEPEREPLAFTVPHQGFPIAAPAKDGWLVAWREEDKLRSALVDLEGVARPFPLGLPASATGPMALAAGDAGWLMVWAGTSVQVTRLNDDGAAALESYSLDSPSQVRIARSNAGWAVAWSRWVDYFQSALTVELFDFNGSHLSSRELATKTPGGGGANYTLPFDIAGTANGFQVVWSTPDEGISSLELDSTGQPIGATKKLYQWDAGGVNLAVAPHASWLAFSIGSSNYFAPLPSPPEYDTSGSGFLMGLRTVGGSAILAWAGQYGGYSGRLAIAAPGELPRMSDVRFATYATGYGFNLSESSGNQALLVTQANPRPFGIPRSRLQVGVVTVSENLDGQGGEGGASGAGGGDGGGGGGADDGLGSAGGAVGGAPSDTDETAMSGAAATAAGNPSTEPEGQGADASAAKPRQVSGCGCHVGSQPHVSGAFLGMLLLGVSLAARRRIRREAASR